MDVLKMILFLAIHIANGTLVKRQLSVRYLEDGWSMYMTYILRGVVSYSHHLPGHPNAKGKIEMKINDDDMYCTSVMYV